MTCQVCKAPAFISVEHTDKMTGEILTFILCEKCAAILTRIEDEE